MIFINSIDEKTKQIGEQLYNGIDQILRDGNKTRSDLARKLERSATSLNKLLYDLRAGRSSLKNLVLLSVALDFELSAFFEKCANIKEDKKTMYNQIITNAINNMPPGTRFELKELFSPSVWNPISYPDRQSFGRDFNRDVLAGMYPRIRFIGKKSNNHAEYEKY